MTINDISYYWYLCVFWCLMTRYLRDWKHQWRRNGREAVKRQSANSENAIVAKYWSQPGEYRNDSISWPERKLAAEEAAKICVWNGERRENGGINVGEIINNVNGSSYFSDILLATRLTIIIITCVVAYTSVLTCQYGISIGWETLK